MKIIHLVLGKANPARMNGVNKVVYYLAREQERMGCKLSVWGITPTPEIQSAYNQSFDIKLFQSMGKGFKIDSELVMAIKTLDPETVFHIHGAFIPAYISVTRLLRKQNIPYVFTPHGAYNAQAMKKSRIQKWLFITLFEKKLLRKASCVQILGRNELLSARRIKGNISWAIVPNGQVITDIKLKKTWPRHSHHPIFCYMGRLDIQHKGLDLLLEGFNIFKKQAGGKAKLWLIGDGDDRSKLETFVREHHLEKEVEFWGAKFEDDKTDLLIQADAFYHTSRYEGMPMAVLEVALLGIPCVVSDGTNMLEYVKEYDAGIELQQNTPLEIAQSMSKIEIFKQLNNLQEMGDHARNMVTAEFGWNRIAGTLSSIYSQSLNFVQAG
jgi:glycosyltransferase involved in cell wall biosynthesis